MTTPNDPQTTDITPAIEEAAEELHRRDAAQTAEQTGEPPASWADLPESFKHAYRSDIRASLDKALDGEEMARVLAETSPCVWSIPEEKHPYGETCLDEHPDRHPGIGFCWVRPRKQAEALRAWAIGEAS